MINFFLSIFFLNLFIFIFYKSFSKIYNLFDYPDKKRKIHKKPVPLLGGLFLTFNLLVILICVNFFTNLIIIDFFEDYKIYNIFFFIFFCFYLIGYYDDKYKISYNLKFFLSIVLIVLILFLDKNILLNKLVFSFLDYEINLNFLSYPITILCFLLFINAFNMLDGINGQAATYVLFILILFLFKEVLIFFSITIILFLLFFLILNFKNKSFLGDSGTIPLGYMISYIFIKLYNSNKVFLVDEVFLIMSIPGFELLRLSIQRIINKKHPFLPDNNHIHHLIIKKFRYNYTFFIVQFLLVFPYLTYIISFNFFISFFLSLFLYIFLVIYFKKNNKNFI
jgi:UDP-GlcNAc:undecaprenyl-phosphate GlcNAc-1-phosphate transferase